jgi:glycosyltransferase involved in cell wall biosynthesis
MRIVLWTETFLPHIDGVVTRLTYTLEALRRAGDETLVVAPARRGLPECYAGARVVGVPSLPLPIYSDFAVGLPFASRRARQVVTAFRPHVIHAINPVVMGTEAIWLARRRRIPLVASFHTNLPAYCARYHVRGLEGAAWWYLRQLHNRARLNLCTSRPVLDLLTARGFRHVKVWQPGVDGELFVPTRRAPEWRGRLTGGHPDRVILLSVGRLAAEKELARLAPAVARLHNAHLALVGAGPARRSLETTFLGLPVTFVGPLRGEALAAAYASADIFVLPSSTETLGLVAMEAMAAGLPVVAASRGGLPDVVDDGRTGLLFDPAQQDDLFEGVASLARDDSMRSRMGRAAHERARRWSWTAATERLRAEYQRLLASGNLL